MEKMKTIKVSPEIHKKVKQHCASIDGQNISDFADYALLNALPQKKYEPDAEAVNKKSKPTKK